MQCSSPLPLKVTFILDEILSLQKAWADKNTSHVSAELLSQTEFPMKFPCFSSHLSAIDNPLMSRNQLIYISRMGMSVTWPSWPKMCLAVGLLSGTAASTRQHQEWTKKTPNRPAWVKCKVHPDHKMKLDFLGPFSLHPQPVLLSGAVPRPYRQAWTAVQSTVGS